MNERKDIGALRARLEETRGREYWRSLEAVSQTPEFQEYLHREFPQNASEWLDPVGRRGFLKLMSASLALAGVSACTRQPYEEIVPYVRQPEELVPGKPLFYATAMPFAGSGAGVLVESHEGRPTKIEGNPDHPSSRGATDLFAQASVLNLYDPDRSRTLTNLGDIRPFSAFVSAVRDMLAAQQGKGGAGFRLMTETIASPTLAAQIRELLQVYPQGKWIQWEPVGRHNAREGSRMAFGDYVETQYAFDKADVVFSLDADFMCTGAAGIKHARAFAARRRVSSEHQQPVRFYAVESNPTPSGSKADHRLPMRASQIEAFARAVAAQVGVAGAGASQLPEAANKWIASLVKDLQAARGRSIVVAGDYQPPVVHALAHAMNAALGNVGQTVTYTQTPEIVPTNQLAALKELVGEMNAGQVEFLLVIGANPVYTAPADLKFSTAMQKVAVRAHVGLYEDETAALSHWHVPQTHYLEEWSDVRADDGTVTIIQPLIAPLYGGKSAHEVIAAMGPTGERSGYDLVREFWRAQSGLGGGAAAGGQRGGGGATVPPFGAAGQGANNLNPSVASSPTPAIGAAPAPAAGPIAGRTTGATGVAPLGQAGQRPQGSPAEQPLANQQASGRATPQGAPQNGAPVAGQAQGGAEGQGTATFSPSPGPSPFDMAWRRWLNDGVVPNTAFTPRTVAVNGSFATSAPAAGEGLEVLFQADPTVYDGRFANNAWLQELPKSMTKMTWDNPALIAPSTAARLNLVSGDIVELKRGNTTVQLPIWLAPGHAPDSLTLSLGYGRTRAGRVGNNIGFDVSPLRTSTAPDILGGVQLRKTGDTYELACTQDHWSLEGRNLVRVATTSEYEKEPKFAAKMEEVPLTGISMLPDFKYDGYAWGMAIDQNVCTGCNACVVACVSENNIPVVGKSQVLNGREMHWLRIDRYYTGDIDSPDTYHQPMPCQQCETAPCEVVCPVGATVHSADGLNDMVYNRCVGTRYCSNNCPYKVRRFNFLLYQDWDTESIKLQRNPDVTVRSRGVMEKCTYCVQRIREAEINAKVDDRRIRDGEILTACQAACPTNAIVFGDINDPNSRVSQMKKSTLNYALLAELNTRPRTTYLAVVRNPNTELEPPRARSEGEEN
jgi:molybdopterin-containing oxidoreductase family iron-sulfur binding subunit